MRYDAGIPRPILPLSCGRLILVKRLSVIRFLRRFHIQTRLLCAMLGCSLIPITLFGLYASNVYAGTIHEKVCEHTAQSLTLLTRNMEIALEPYCAYLNTLSVSDDMRQLLDTYEGKGEYSSYLGTILRSGLSAFGAGQHLRDLQIYSPKGELIGSTGYEDTGDALKPQLFAQLDHPSSGWYLGMTSSGTLILGRRLFRFAPKLSPKGYLLLCISPQLLAHEIFADLSFGEGTVVFWVSNDGTPFFPAETPYAEILTSALTDRKGADPINVRLDGKHYLLMNSRSDAYGCCFAVAMPYSAIRGRMDGVLQMLVLVAAGLFVLSFLAMLLVYASIVQPIRHMLQHCNDELPILVRPLNDNSPDELGVLARTQDHLIARLWDMAKQQKQNEQRKRELELAALQYQINPHFLFNTLNTFKWIAELNGVPALQDGIASLCALLKSTLLNQNDMQPLENELQDLSHYFSIQKLRYADGFDVVYQVDQAMLGIMVPRFLLQPLAENAIVHGLDDSGKIMTITIGARKDGENGLLLTVQDDGAGFDQEAQPVREHFSGIGVSNVNERLRLHYGDGYGVTIKSRPRAGTLCTIRLPMTMEVTSHVSTAPCG